nr:MAG TPA: hypothetical protein [Caudoviricetes sp.]
MESCSQGAERGGAGESGRADCSRLCRHGKDRSICGALFVLHGQALFPRRRGRRLYRYAYRRDAWRHAHDWHCRYLRQCDHVYRGRINHRGLASVSPHFGGIYGTHF